MTQYKKTLNIKRIGNNLIYTDQEGFYSDQEIDSPEDAINSIAEFLTEENDIRDYEVVMITSNQYRATYYNDKPLRIIL